jgi:Flp pilus assembly protein TadG
MRISGRGKLEPETGTVARFVAIDIRQLKGDCGSGLVEYAIVFLLFMTMILGVIDFGRALYTYHFLSNVTRDATRWAAVNGSTCVSDNSCNAVAGPTDVQNFVTNHTPPGIDTSKITTTASWPGNGTAGCPLGSEAPTCTVKVQVRYAFSFISPLVSTVVPATACGSTTANLCLNSASEMIIAH